MDDLILYKERETTGCTFEDGSDTRKTKIIYCLIPQSEEQTYLDDLTSNYENQDYSYQFGHSKLISLPKMVWFELYEIMKKLDEQGSFDICKELEKDELVKKEWKR
mgnify:CR=1 FL=1